MIVTLESGTTGDVIAGFPEVGHRVIVMHRDHNGMLTPEMGIVKEVLGCDSH